MIYRFLTLALLLSNPVIRAEATYPDSPKEVQQAAIEWLVRNWKDASKIAPSLTSDSNISSAWRRYHIGSASGILHASFPENTQVTNWSVTVTPKHDIAGSLIIIANDKEGAKVVAFLEPASAIVLDQAVRSFNVSANNSNAVYEIREFIDFSLKFRALWLHSEQNDLFIPLEFVGPQSEFKIYSITEIKNLLKERVEAAIHHNVWNNEGG